MHLLPVYLPLLLFLKDMDDLGIYFDNLFKPCRPEVLQYIYSGSHELGACIHHMVNNPG